MLVLDANILIRAVLGVRVHFLLKMYADRVRFFAPESAFEEARDRIPAILQQRRLPVAPGLAALNSLSRLVGVVEQSFYARMESVARQRFKRRDEDDWPMLAAALVLACAIWTEDMDFFGCGVATWTCHCVEFYLSEAAQRPNDADTAVQ